jgi:hypothetical protein
VLCTKEANIVSGSHDALEAIAQDSVLEITDPAEYNHGAPRVTWRLPASLTSPYQQAPKMWASESNFAHHAKFASFDYQIAA